MPRHARSALALVILLAWGFDHAAAQGLEVRSLTGEIAADFDGRDLSYPDGFGYGYGRFREWLLLRAAGSVVTPGLLDFDLTLRPTIGQLYWNGAAESSSGSLFNLNGGGRLSLLARRPVSFSVDALSLDETQDLQFGGEQTYDLRTWGARVDARWPALPVKLEYRERYNDRLVRASPESFSRRNDAYRRLRFEARNSKTNLLLERTGFEDYVGSADFRQFLGRLDHGFRWGKGSRLNSLFSYLDRAGSGERQTVSWRQGALLQHTRAVASEAGYNLYDTDVPGDFNRGWGANYLLRWDPRPRARLSVEGFTQSESFRVGSRSYTRVRPGAEVTIGRPRRQLRLAATTGYEWHRQETSESGGSAFVSAEPHVFDTSRRFFLERPFAEASTIVIRSEDGTSTFVRGFDYELVSDQIFVEVVALPGGELGAGSAVLVDYTYFLLPSGDADAWTYSYDISLGLGPVTLYHRRSKQEQLGNGPPALIPTLLEYDNLEAGFRLASPTPIGAVSLGAEYSRRSARPYSFEGFSVSGTWTFLSTRSLRGHAAVSWWNRTNGIDFEMLQGEATLEWTVRPGLRLLGRMSAYDWDEEDGRQERFLGAGLGAEWKLRQLTMSIRYDRRSWDLANQRSEDRLVARLSREL